VYETRRDADGVTTVVFGDGAHGARLPSGTENVVASYRHGLGPAGEVPAESLVLLQTRPLGVQTVTNPLPATGGAPPEAPDDARVRAPARVLSIGRVVAAEDVEAFVRSFAGIGAASAALVATPTTTVMHVTVAGTGGDAVPAGGALATALEAALDHARNRWRPLRIDSYRPVPIEVAARLLVGPDQPLAAVLTAAEQAVRNALSVTRRGLNRGVHRSEVIATLQRVPGVVAVDLDRMAVVGDPSPGPALVATRPARWEAGGIVAAEAVVVGAVSLSAAVSSGGGR
jgi:predicted phage baseplate assembly protein